MIILSNHIGSILMPHINVDKCMFLNLGSNIGVKTYYVYFSCEMHVEKKWKVEESPILGTPCDQWIVPTQEQKHLPPL